MEPEKKASGDPEREKGEAEKIGTGENPTQAFEEEEWEQGESEKSKRPSEEEQS